MNHYGTGTRLKKSVGLLEQQERYINARLEDGGVCMFCTSIIYEHMSYRPYPFEDVLTMLVSIFLLLGDEKKGRVLRPLRRDKMKGVYVTEF